MFKLKGKNMSEKEVSPDTVWQLQFEFLKQISTLTLASVGGEITLLEMVFIDNEYKFLAYISIVFLLIATILCTEAQEIMVDRLAKKANIGSASNTFLKLPRTQGMQQVMTTLSIMLFSVGVVLFALFALVF